MLQARTNTVDPGLTIGRKVYQGYAYGLNIKPAPDVAQRRTVMNYRTIILVFVLSMLLGLVIVMSAHANCTTYIMPDGRIVQMCCSPDGRMCQVM